MAVRRHVLIHPSDDKIYTFTAPLDREATASVRSEMYNELTSSLFYAQTTPSVLGRYIPARQTSSAAFTSADALFSAVEAYEDEINAFRATHGDGRWEKDAAGRVTYAPMVFLVRAPGQAEGSAEGAKVVLVQHKD